MKVMHRLHRRGTAGQIASEMRALVARDRLNTGRGQQFERAAHIVAGHEARQPPVVTRRHSIRERGYLFDRTTLAGLISHKIETASRK